MLWPNFPKFTSEGLFPNQTLISGPTFNDWTINCDHFVDPDIPNTNGPVMRLSVPLDLTLDDIIPKLRIRLYDHLGLGVTTQIYLKIYGVYLEIDWQANHGLTPVWAPPSTNVGYPILSTDEFNPTTGVYSGPTVGHPVALKMWGNPADANSRGILSLITEHH